MIRVRPVLAALLVSAASAAPALVRPEPPGSSREPDLLSPYERRVLQYELADLMKEIRFARLEASRDESLAPLREALEAARAEGVATNVQAAARALSDATETLLYAKEGMPAKLKRLAEVGRLLEYDTPREKRARAHALAVAPKAPPPEPALPAPEDPDGAAPAGNPAPAPDEPETETEDAPRS